jgi:hypothetical protein
MCRYLKRTNVANRAPRDKSACLVGRTSLVGKAAQGDTD